MKLGDFISKLTGSGSWGILGAVSLVLLAMIMALLVVRRERADNNGHAQGRNVWFSFIPIVLFLISGTWSGWAKFQTYAPYNEIQAWVIAGGFVLCGGVTAIALQHFANVAIRESGPARASQILLLLFFSLLWLGISPFLNARFLCENETIKQEVSLRFTDLDTVSQPLIEEYSFYRNKLIPQLVEIHKYLESMVEEQSKPELGGCGKICRQFKQSADMLSPTVNRLYRNYDPDDPEKDLNNSVHDLRNSIVNLLAGNDWSAEEIRTRFYQYASRWAELLYQAKNVDPPGLALKQAMASLDALLVFLNDYQKTHITTSIEQRAVNAALSTLKPLINDLDIAFREHDQSHNIMPVTGQLQITSGQPAIVNLASIATIRMGTKLMRKHIKTIWSDAVLAFFIDLVAMSFVYGPMMVALLRGRPIQLAMDRVHRKQYKVRRVKAKLDTIVRPAAVLEQKKNALVKRHEKNLSAIAEARAKALEAVEQTFEQQFADLNSKRQVLLALMNNQLQTVTNDQEKALKIAISSHEEDTIRGRHAVYSQNIRERYTCENEGINQLEHQLRDTLDKEIHNAKDGFTRREEREIDSYSRANKSLDKKRQHLEELRTGCIRALDEAKQELDEAQRKLTNARGNGYSFA